MINRTTAATFQRLSKRVDRIMRELEPLADQLVLRCDRHTLAREIGSLTWVRENLSVIGDHLLGRRLGDDMGYWHSYDVGRKMKLVRSRSLAKGLTIEQTHQRELAVAERKTLRSKSPTKSSRS